MGLAPRMPRVRASFLTKTCTCCGQDHPAAHYIRSKSILAADGFADVCNDCIGRILRENDFNWKIVNQICAALNIPFIPKEWVRFLNENPDDAFQRYAAVFFKEEYEHLDWGMYFDEFKKLEKMELIEQELPLIQEERLEKMRDKWGANYSEEELSYLDTLYNGMLQSQNVNGALQVDQAEKLCKISLEIDSRIRAGTDFDKILASYDKLVKIAEFTPKNAKNASDFDSAGELFKWLEKRGWKNKFYDNVTRDVVDETLKNFQAFNQRLYTNETGIGEEITRRIEALKIAADAENLYDTDKTYDLDAFENEAFDELYSDEEFEVDV